MTKFRMIAGLFLTLAGFGWLLEPVPANAGPSDKDCKTGPYSNVSVLDDRVAA